MNLVNFKLSELQHSHSNCELRELSDCIAFKKLVRLEIYLKNIPKLSQQIEKLCLHHSISDESFKVVVDSNMDNWASSLIECSDSDINAMRFVYIHHDKAVCEKAKFHDSIDDDLNLGLLLQYPKCCVDEYLNWQKSNDDIDPVTTLTNSLFFTGQVSNFEFPNPFSRYFAAGLYSHFPCSLHCEQTKEIAKHSFEKLKINFPSVAEKLFQFENSLVIFNKNKGICLWSNYDKFKSKIYLDQNYFIGQGELKNVFKQVVHIETLAQELLLFSNSNEVSSFNANNCFIGTFNSVTSKAIV